MLPSGATGSGESDAVICMSACGATYDVETVTALFAVFGSNHGLLTLKSSLMVWLLMPNCATPALSTIVNGEVDDAARFVVVQVNDAPFPTASDGQVHPAGTVIDCQSSVLLRSTLKFAVVAGSGPLLSTLTV